MAAWSTLKKVVVFGVGGLVLLVVVAGIFGEDPKKSSKSTTATTQAANTSSTTDDVQSKAKAFASCMKQNASVYTWQTSVPKVGRPTKWDEVDHEAVVYGGKVIAVPAGVAVYKGAPSYWSVLWVANSPADAKQATVALGDPNDEGETQGYNAQRVEAYGLWEIWGGDEGKSQVVASSSNPSQADIDKTDLNVGKKLDATLTSCGKKVGVIAS